MPKPRTCRQLTQEERSACLAAWNQGCSRAEIAAAAGISISLWDETKSTQLGLPSRQGRGGGPKRRSTYRDPTPQEIEQRAAEVREAWTEHDFALRAGFPPIDQREVLSPRAYTPIYSNLDTSMLTDY